ncbi:MAG: queuosine salvage family protein [Acidimicrobiales bacterium]
MPSSPPGILDQVRADANRVLASARFVRLVPEAVDAEARSLLDDRPERRVAAAASDPWAVATGDDAVPAGDEARVATVVTLAAVNFGSGWHPVVRKLPGCSGAVTMATHLRRRVAAVGAPTADWLAGMTTEATRQLFDQPAGPVDDLMALFADALRQLGETVAADHGGSFLSLVEAGGGTAEGLVTVLGHIPTFHDVASLDGHEVAFYKRAQLAVADLDRAFGGTGPGRFTDLDRLTAFADNLVPHVLRLDGVLAFDDGLVADIEAGRLLAAGGRAEIEIRAAAVAAVDALVAASAAHGARLPAHELDLRLWQRGGRPAYKAVPRHRARSPFY